MGLSRLQNLSQSGQLALGRLLDSDDIDFLCSPCQYHYRADEKPFTYSSVMGPFAHSGACRNKLVFLEDDHPPARARHSGAFLSTRDPWHDEMFFRRNFAQVMTHGQQMWWYSLGAQWFKDPYRQKVAGELHRVGLEAVKRDRGPVAEVAVVVDERSVSAMRLNAPFQQALLTDSLAAFYPTGAPVECHELHSFLNHADHSRFKVIAFLNLFRLDRDLLAAVNKLKSGNRTLMFSFAPGVLMDTPGSRVFSMDSASALVGMRLEEQKENVPLTVWVDPERVSLMGGGEDIRYGWLDAEIPIQPVIGIRDDGVEPLGFLHGGTPGFGRKAHPQWTSVFSAAPCMPPEVLQALLEEAGVHLYTRSRDVIYANRSMVACQACSAGKKKLRLPRPASLTDALNGAVVQPRSDGSHEIVMKRHETLIFWVGEPMRPEDA